MSSPVPTSTPNDDPASSCPVASSSTSLEHGTSDAASASEASRDTSALVVSEASRSVAIQTKASEITMTSIWDQGPAATPADALRLLDHLFPLVPVLNSPNASDYAWSMAMGETLRRVFQADSLSTVIMAIENAGHQRDVNRSLLPDVDNLMTRAEAAALRKKLKDREEEIKFNRKTLAQHGKALEALRAKHLKVASANVKLGRERDKLREKLQDLEARITPSSGAQLCDYLQDAYGSRGKDTWPICNAIFDRYFADPDPAHAIQPGTVVFHVTAADPQPFVLAQASLTTSPHVADSRRSSSSNSPPKKSTSPTKMTSSPPRPDQRVVVDLSKTDSSPPKGKGRAKGKRPLTLIDSSGSSKKKTRSTPANADVVWINGIECNGQEVSNTHFITFAVANQTAAEALLDRLVDVEIERWYATHPEDQMWNRRCRLWYGVDPAVTFSTEFAEVINEWISFMYKHRLALYERLHWFTSQLCGIHLAVRKGRTKLARYLSGARARANALRKAAKSASTKVNDLLRRYDLTGIIWYQPAIWFFPPVPCTWIPVSTDLLAACDALEKAAPVHAFWTRDVTQHPYFVVTGQDPLTAPRYPFPFAPENDAVVDIIEITPTQTRPEIFDHPIPTSI